MHEDERGLIKDLYVGDDCSATLVTFNKDAVRGNHYHKETTQFDVVMKGKLIVFQNEKSEILKYGDFARHNPNDKHAYKALEDSVLLSICFGKRIGENYESDTFRLKDNDKLI